MSDIPIYEVSNDPSCDVLYQKIFSYPGILVVREFPLTESRFRVLKKSFSYEEIVEEVHYCIGSMDSATRLGRLIKDHLLMPDASFLYPEMIRVLIEASIATIVKDITIKQKLALMFPDLQVYFVADGDYGAVMKAFETLKGFWRLPANFPRHLQPLTTRAQREISDRIQIPDVVRASLHL